MEARKQEKNRYTSKRKNVIILLLKNCTINDKLQKHISAAYMIKF